MSDINWSAIREEYENGASLRALATKYGVGKSAIGERKFREQWTQERTDTDTQGGTNIPIRDANAATRVAQAIKHRQAGWTYERIAAMDGYANATSCRRAIQRELDREIAQSVHAWRNDHIARLEKLHEEAWELMLDKDSKSRLFAFDRLMLIEEREAKLLGLDKPVIADEAKNTIVIREVPQGLLPVKIVEAQ